MAGVIKWKMMSCEQSGRRSAEIARECLSLAPNRYKCHSYQHIGYLGDSAEGFICRPLKSKLRSKVGLHVAAKVHNKDDEGSCSSRISDEDNETLSNASRKMEVNHLGALRCYFSKLNTEDAQKPYSFHQTNKQKTGPLSTNIEEANMATDYGDFRNTLESFEINFNRRKKVLLFEIASPVRNSDIENLSLPLMYGAKINDLILSGEWWRLLTPMCLHSGFLHIALGCWVLLIFGPRVSRAYGQTTFLLMYILGGVCGNLTSYVHTTHLGATICGLLFGYLTCPSVQLDNAAKKGQKAVCKRLLASYPLVLVPSHGFRSSMAEALSLSKMSSTGRAAGSSCSGLCWLSSSSPAIHPQER
uniref:Peptidase S54 rhomboid domain-containing protein n=1 Tax=Oryza meridionalis TaxID=40149 RepID=A0A0E0CJW3_9ORYZ